LCSERGRRFAFSAPTNSEPEELVLKLTKPRFDLPSMPADVWLPLRETSAYLRSAGIERADDWIRAKGDDGTLPCKRLDTGVRQFSLLGLMAFVKEARHARKKKAR
jgi:hypothetical protein